MDSKLLMSFVIAILISISSAAPPNVPSEDLTESGDNNSSAVVEVLNELKKLGKLSEKDDELPSDWQNQDIENIRIVEDPREIEGIISKELSSDGDVIEDFQPITMPTDFCEYDVDGNGFIDRSELLQVTGAVENMDIAFNESDTNGKLWVPSLNWNHFYLH